MNYLTDVPVTDLENDLLELRPMSDALFKYIKSSETPTTIGIQGDWGVGKTSLLRMIQKNIEANEEKKRVTRGKSPKEIKFFYFNTWQYAQFNQQDHMIFSLFDAVLECLDNQEENPRIEKLKRTLTRVSYIASISASQFFKKTTGVDATKVLSETDKQMDDPSNVDMFDIAKELAHYRNEFQTLLNDITKAKKIDKFVLAFDDLDRLKPSAALDIMEAFKNFLDVPHCIFIFAVDYQIIQRGVEEKFGSDVRNRYGKSFFDKIIQLPFNMPVSSYDINRYIMFLMGWVRNNNENAYSNPDKNRFLNLRLKDRKSAKWSINLFDFENDDYRFFERMCKIITNGNPRSIKRIANYANLLRLVCTKNNYFTNLDDAKIVFSLACLQMEWPEILSYLAENPSRDTLLNFQKNLQEEHPALYALKTRTSDVNALEAQLTQFFEEILKLLLIKDEKKERHDLKRFWDMIIRAKLGNQEYISIHHILKGLSFYSMGRRLIDTHWNNDDHLRIRHYTESIYILYWDAVKIAYLIKSKRNLRLLLVAEVDVFDGKGLDQIVVKGQYHSYGNSEVKIRYPKQNDPSYGDIHRDDVENLNKVLFILTKDTGEDEDEDENQDECLPED